MGALVLDVFLVALAAVIGGGTGWFLRGDGPWETEPAPEIEAAIKRAQSDNEGILEELHVREDENIGLKEELDTARLEAEHAKDALAELHRIAAAMTADVNEHNRSVRAISEGLDDEGEASDIVACVEQLFSANSRMQSQLANAEQELEAKQAEIVSHLQEARTDALTTLANRRAFDIEMERCEQEFESSNVPACVMVIDVDHFKKFNDTYGHQAGDEVLRGVARVLSDSVTDQQIVCRYGGEEFCVIFPASDMQSAIPIAEKARTAIGEAVFHHEGQDLHVKASGGLAQFLKAESHQDLVKRADDALYVCKESGRDCGHWHDGDESHRMAPKDERKDDAESGDKLQRDIDPLTQLTLKEPFVESLKDQVAGLTPNGEKLSVIFIRVDGFNAVTDGFGTPAGDRVLRSTAQFMESAMRETDTLARYDFDRFGIILPNTSGSDASTIADRIRELAEHAKLPTDAGLLRFTISLSVTEGEPNDTVDTITARLENGIKVAIDAGGNQFQLVEPTATS